ncbi:MAG: hypothetical protein HZRFUVUK_001199 [Candidatus Fervidibacterota bacterium]|jgi:imidazoleglycerol phosphate synthase glutamine amidotransferase subunit HisH
MLEVTIVNYGVGNLMSVLKAFEFIGCKATLTDDPEAVAKANCLVLPGVGAYGAGMKKLGERCLVEPISHMHWKCLRNTVPPGKERASWTEHNPQFR